MRIVFVYAILFLMVGCGGLKVMKECSKAEDRLEYVCKSLGFWE